MGVGGGTVLSAYTTMAQHTDSDGLPSAMSL